MRSLISARASFWQWALEWQTIGEVSDPLEVSWLWLPWRALEQCEVLIKVDLLNVVLFEWVVQPGSSSLHLQFDRIDDDWLAEFDEKLSGNELSAFENWLFSGVEVDVETGDDIGLGSHGVLRMLEKNRICKKWKFTELKEKNEAGVKKNGLNGWNRPKESICICVHSCPYMKWKWWNKYSRRMTHVIATVTKCMYFLQVNLTDS